MIKVLALDMGYVTYRVQIGVKRSRDFRRLRNVSSRREEGLET